MTRNTAKQPRVGDLPEVVLKLIVDTVREGNEDWQSLEQARAVFLSTRSIRMRTAWIRANPDVYLMEEDDDIDWLDQIKAYFGDGYESPCPVEYVSSHIPGTPSSRFGYVNDKIYKKMSAEEPDVPYYIIGKAAFLETIKVVDHSTDQYIGEQYV